MDEGRAERRHGTWHHLDEINFREVRKKEFKELVEKELVDKDAVEHSWGEINFNLMHMKSISK